MGLKMGYQTDHCTINDHCLGDFTGHHLKTRGSGGPDETWNMMPVCTLHHNQAHSLGLIRMSIKYPQVRQWLDDNGWQFDEYSGKYLRSNHGG
jgi:hypothetical protein